MDVPRIGVSLPHFGPYAGPDAVVTVAQAAERFGFHAVSVSDRLLMPVRPDWSNDAELPESHVWDPLEMLTWAAADTRRIRVSTGIVNAIFQPPIVLGAAGWPRSISSPVGASTPASARAEAVRPRRPI